MVSSASGLSMVAFICSRNGSTGLRQAAAACSSTPEGAGKSRCSISSAIGGNAPAQVVDRAGLSGLVVRAAGAGISDQLAGVLGGGGREPDMPVQHEAHPAADNEESSVLRQHA